MSYQNEQVAWTSNKLKTEKGALSQRKKRDIRRISPYSFRMQENTDQNNSEYEHFSRSDR